MVATRLRRLARFDVLALTALVWFLGKFLRYAFPPLFETIGGTYGVSRAVLGTAFTGFMLVYALLQLPSGLLADRFGSVRVIAGGSLVAGGGALALVVDSPFPVLVGAMLCMGAGTGAYKTVGVRLLSRTYPAQTGRVLGVFDTFGTFGGVAAPAVVVVVAGLPPVFGAPWRTLFLAAAVATLGLAVAFRVQVPKRLARQAASERPAAAGTTSTDNPSGGSLGRHLALFRRPPFAAFVLVTVLFGFAYNGAVAFLPLYLVSETAVTSATASLLYSALFAVSAVQLATGEASDRAGALPVMVVALGVATAGLLAILAASEHTGPLVLGAAVLTLGLGAHGFRPVRGAYLMDVVPDAIAGGSFGVVRTLLMGAGAVAPAVVGYLSEVADFRVAFGALALALVSATALTGLLWLFDR